MLCSLFFVLCTLRTLVSRLMVFWNREQSTKFKVQKLNKETMANNFLRNQSMDFTLAPVKSPITIADFEKVDIRVGTILSVEDVASSDKLMKLTVDFGDHRRSILAGIKQERENPREIEGKQALFIVNLRPREMMGQISEGMVFDLGYADGVKPALAIPETKVPNGTRAG